MRLSEETRVRLEALFDPADWARAVALLEEECGTNLPFCEDSTPEQLDRLRFAALKVSGGDYERLMAAVRLAQIDWRDLLVDAGFQHDTLEHTRWWPAT